MEELRNLQQIYSLASGKFNQYDGNDFVLPLTFKEQVKEINGNTVTYNSYSAIIQTKGYQRGYLNIFLPNQWFYMASYFTDFYNELIRYKKYALKVATKERLKVLDKGNLTAEEKNSLQSLDLNDTSKNYLNRFITDYDWWHGAKTIDRGDFYVSPILACACLVNASQSYVVDLCVFLADKQDLAKIIIDGVDKITIEKAKSSKQQYSTYRPYITAIKSKPFLLLAGISGTGKSRIVRELARACWDEGTDEYKAQKPRNFQMVQVKPNWHDSSDLIGYVSRVSGKAEFVAGEFLKFIAKAWENTETPYFLCLDEMNLAPVEQYFAEYLSVIESRKSHEDGTVTTDPIVEKADEEWYFNLTASLTSDEDIRKQFNEQGICIPQNLIVVGTVNMDETTFSFSRKVLDRAMTIEMNEVDLHGGLTERNEPIGKLDKAELIGYAVEGMDVYAANKEVCETVLTYLDAVNSVLEGTPFKVAYRTRNEFLLYVVNNLPYKKGENDEELPQGYVVARALDEITGMKVLSRIEGDDTKVSDKLLDSLTETIEEGLKEVSGEENTVKSISLAKLKEMKDKLVSGYTSFWS
ncbi:McrB family protein [Prevotella multiformis]|uniref:McrB family protein n=1 Tax=Prevotella multiformis TaxID=282402 RepID=UPI001FEAC0F1|nr:AAA family ATPase [Prevotella multiformis]